MGFIEIPYFPKTYSRNKPYITKIRKASQTTIKLRPLRRDDVIPNFKCRIYLEKVNFSALFQRPAKELRANIPLQGNHFTRTLFTQEQVSHNSEEVGWSDSRGCGSASKAICKHCNKSVVLLGGYVESHSQLV